MEVLKKLWYTKTKRSFKDELEGEYPDVKFCKINVDNERELAMSFNVTSIPLVAFVKDNTYLDFSLGYVPKEKLAGMIEANK